MFTFNSADGPLCNTREWINCSDGSFAPPLSIMGLDIDKVDTLPAALRGKRPKAFPDLLVPMFKVNAAYLSCCNTQMAASSVLGTLNSCEALIKMLALWSSLLIQTLMSTPMLIESSVHACIAERHITYY